MLNQAPGPILTHLVHHILKSGEQGPVLRQYMTTMWEKPSLQDAAPNVKHKLPAAVVFLVDKSARLRENPVTTRDPIIFSDEPMTKARMVSNDLTPAGMKSLII